MSDQDRQTEPTQLEDQTVPEMRLEQIDLYESSQEGVVVLRIQSQGVSENVKIGPNVFVNDRPLSPQWFQVPKQDLKKMLKQLLGRLDELS